MMRWWLAMMALLVGCAGVPKGLHPVGGFELERYLGRWYEIARLNHSFERGLTNVSAEYRLLPDGRVEVVNRGFDPAKKAWRAAKGRGTSAVWRWRFSGRFMARTMCWCSTRTSATRWWRGRIVIICGYSRASRSSIAPRSTPWSSAQKAGALRAMH